MIELLTPTISVLEQQFIWYYNFVEERTEAEGRIGDSMRHGICVACNI